MNNSTPIMYELRKIFNYFSINGKFTQESLQNVGQILLQSTLPNKPNIANTIKSVFLFLDTQAKGSLTFQDFYQRCVYWFEITDTICIFQNKILYEEGLTDEEKYTLHNLIAHMFTCGPDTHWRMSSLVSTALGQHYSIDHVNRELDRIGYSDTDKAAKLKQVESILENPMFLNETVQALRNVYVAEVLIQNLQALYCLLEVVEYLPLKFEKFSNVNALHKIMNIINLSGVFERLVHNILSAQKIDDFLELQKLTVNCLSCIAGICDITNPPKLVDGTVLVEADALKYMLLKKEICSVIQKLLDTKDMPLLVCSLTFLIKLVRHVPESVGILFQNNYSLLIKVLSIQAMNPRSEIAQRIAHLLYFLSKNEAFRNQLLSTSAIEVEVMKTIRLLYTYGDIFISMCILDAMANFPLQLPESKVDSLQKANDLLRNCSNEAVQFHALDFFSKYVRENKLAAQLAINSQFISHICDITIVQKTSILQIQALRTLKQIIISGLRYIYH